MSQDGSTGTRKGREDVSKRDYGRRGIVEETGVKDSSIGGKDRVGSGRVTTAKGSWMTCKMKSTCKP